MANCCEPGTEMPAISIDAMGEGRPSVDIDANDNALTLNLLPIGKNALIQQVGGEGALRQHFLDMGLIPGAHVTMVKHAPMGDPVQVRINGYELTLRLGDAARITLCDVVDEEVARIGDAQRNTAAKARCVPGRASS